MNKKLTLPLSTSKLGAVLYTGSLACVIGAFALPSHAQSSNTADTCGYSLSTGTYATWPRGYQAWVDVNNLSGETATDFEVLLDVGNTQIKKGNLAEYEQVENGYLVSAPHWLKHQKIRQGASYRFQFNGTPEYEGVTPYLLSINGMPCDLEAPQLELAASSTFFVEEDTLTLTATGTDNVAVRSVVFERNGEVIGQDWDAPFELTIDITDALDGFHVYTATAYDPSGNTAAAKPERVFVGINNQFFGTAPGGPRTYEDVLTYFGQITPENAGKWGSVESERDVMNWAGVDTAYQFARDNDLAFRFHTVVWGSQQPGWLDNLSQEEQLAEVDEWMGLIAARYPDLTLVEAVNEPLHAPPSYREALGGAGETGWDWVIKSFEMARKHFPHAQLTLNDYQILHMPQFTQEYLEIITLLQERDLIDAISVQAHFLERVEADMVQRNLDTLAATGLPIYIAEFDLNIADDALHANHFRDLFTVFWEHPAVVGVTHWNHLEGTMWRENAYLINSDGTPRAALEWAVCYMDGGVSCPVPEYVPSGWQGDEYGLTLEAEEFDTGEGVLALGAEVSYTDDGDWIGFSDVEFREEWNNLWVTYSKGNQEVGSISVHLDSLDSYPVATIELPPTAGWGQSDTLELPWDSLSGTRDVYIRFNDTYGVANLDNIRFGQPQQPAGRNLIDDGGFEGSSLSGWQSWNGSTLSLTTGEMYSGNQSLVVTDRPNTGQYAVYNLTSEVVAGTTYALSAQAMLGGSEADTLRLAAKVECANPPEGHNTYPWLDNREGVAPGEWTELSAELVIPDCDVVDVAIFFEGTSAGIDVYLDDVTVTPPSTLNLVNDGSFESGIAGWSAWNGATLSASTEQAHSGSQSLFATDRPNTNQFAVYNLTGVVSAGNTYSVSGQALITGTEVDTVRLAAKVECSNPPEGHNTYPWLDNNSNVVPGEWTELSAELVIPDCDVADVAIFFEGTSAGTDVYIDDVIVTAN